MPSLNYCGLSEQSNRHNLIMEAQYLFGPPLHYDYVCDCGASACWQVTGRQLLCAQISLGARHFFVCDAPRRSCSFVFRFLVCADLSPHAFYHGLILVISRKIL